MPPSRWQLYDRICQVLGMLNRTDEALQLVNTMASEEERCQTLNNIVERISRRGEQSAYAVVATALSDLPFLSRERVLRTLAQIAPRLKDWAPGRTSFYDMCRNYRRRTLMGINNEKRSA